MPVVEPRTGLIDMNAQLLIVRSVALQLIPGTRSQRNAIAVINGAPRQLPSQRIEPGVVLRPFHFVLGENAAIAAQQFLIVQHLVAERLRNEREREQAENRSQYANRLAERISMRGRAGAGG